MAIKNCINLIIYFFVDVVAKDHFLVYFLGKVPVFIVATTSTKK